VGRFVTGWRNILTKAGRFVEGGERRPVGRSDTNRLTEPASPASDAMDLLAGQGVGLVREIKPAGQIVHELVEGARQIIAQRLLGLVQPA
jgi:NAD(P)H-dependent flavin oxidoreductase YrpB (nitropropane dioxygenase family)